MRRVSPVAKQFRIGTLILDV